MKGTGPSFMSTASWITTTIFLYLGMVVFGGYLVLQSNVALADCKVLSQKSSIYQELMPHVLKCKDALLTKNFKKLDSYAIKDQKDYTLSHLEDPKSKLYRYLYEDKESIYKLLRRAQNLRIVLQECFREEYAGFGPVVEVYFYDETKTKLKFPLDWKKYRELFKKGDMFVLHWGKEEQHWETDYNFFD